ncbi:Conserved_hypothetical protein [Hexamita inflata]|uniref:Uncharacterized protein n=1 Tax=Hexamita inflata TaxID=28002 RepID=A0AA86PEU6_9EUKA|nr:Conserved hypothetical protein [Hexamita inflata]CAI9941649.1 Conserved hypothetical protein [Hexamita inflata]
MQYPKNLLFTEQDLIKMQADNKLIIQQYERENLTTIKQVVLSKNGKQFIPSHAFITSLILNPYQSFQRVYAQYMNQQPPVQEQNAIISFFDCNQLNLLIPDKAKNCIQQYDAAYTPQQKQQVAILSHLFEGQYAVRRFSVFFDYQELSPEQLLFLCLNLTFKTADNENMKSLSASFLFDKLKFNQMNFQKLELFFLERINFNIKLDTPEMFIVDQISICPLQVRFDDPILQKNLNLILRIVQCTQIILMVPADIVAQFIVLEAILLQNIGRREELYNGTSHKSELAVCRRYMFEFGTEYDQKQIDKIMPMNGGGINLQFYLEFLKQMFSGITRVE